MQTVSFTAEDTAGFTALSASPPSVGPERGDITKSLHQKFSTAKTSLAKARPLYDPAASIRKAVRAL